MNVIKNKALKFHCYDKNIIYASEGRNILKSNNLGENWVELLTINYLPFLSKFKAFNRLTRNGIHNVIPFDDNVLAVVIKKHILIYKDRQLINVIKIKRGSRPLRQGIIKVNNLIIFGDYWSNINREPVNVYCFNPIKGVLQTLLTLEEKRHIHFIQQDILNSFNLIIGTGDKDNESGIYSYNLKSGELKEVGNGSQDWRAVSILQKENYFFWGSDCPYKQNYIFKYNRNNQELKKIISIDGPAYYSTTNISGEMFIATTIENRKKHKAIIYKSSDGSKWEVFREWEKDIFPEKLFGYGLIEFINGQDKLKDLYVNLQSLS